MDDFKFQKLLGVTSREDESNGLRSFRWLTMSLALFFSHELGFRRRIERIGVGHGQNSLERVFYILFLFVHSDDHLSFRLFTSTNTTSHLQSQLQSTAQSGGIEQPLARQ